ncbi:RING-H2 finger protein ATL46-like [Magnolia sinica]|uniref:RING-H2 finger protein ATL46-like n=1 Tax=Magnolia sinica TaxID=86752 RepID=UPI00265A2D8C|nr:RING-H2 finger protein ATL46-like [Magnolia sinica]
MKKIALFAFPAPKMNWALSQIKKKEGLSAYPPPLPHLLPPPPPYTSSYQKEPSPPSPPSPSGSKISPAVLFIIVILAVIFFISGLLHLLVRFLIKQPSSSSSSQSNRYPEIPGSDSLQRQLQQLFHLHDSGLDQAFIDALPVFLYKEIVGLKEPFDCAVCLCEFSQEDKLRLLPICSHAFHINCIDTWLLSNSTCPLCRGTLFSSALAIENPVFEFDEPNEEDGFSGEGRDGFSANQKVEMEAEEEEEVVVEGVKEEIVSEKRVVLPVRLGKFKSVNNEGEGESSSSNLDARRCYSMGSFQYVVGDSNLQVGVALSQREKDGSEGKKETLRRKGCDEVEVDLDGKKLCNGSKGESLSVSKIWLWSKKGKLQNPCDVRSSDSSSSAAQMGISSSLNVGLPRTDRRVRDM